MNKSCTVLVVNDDDAQRYVIVRMLQSAGYIVIQATTGAEALAEARGGHPNLVMIDINLPDMNGFTVARLLNAEAKTQPLPMVFHSAVSAPWDAKTAELGSFLTTPIEAEHLQHVIEGALARAARAA